jgi:VWFA-related protein
VALFLILGWQGFAPSTTPAAPAGEEDRSSPTVAVTPGVIKSEANLVVVNVSVTDKKQHYLQDLNQKEFHVFQDGAEQTITSFSREANLLPGDPERPRYIVLFFDNSRLGTAGQMSGREAALKFVEGTASPNRMMAVMDFGSIVRIDQDFTANGDLLKSVISQIQFSAPARAATRDEADTDFRTLMLNLRSVAKMLGTAPGRKVVVFLSAGVALNSDGQSDFQNTIDALNKANVGLYPMDSAGVTGSADFQAATSLPSFSAGSLSSGSHTGTSSGARAARSSRPGTTSRTVMTRKELLYTLASQTGGFPVVDTNDLLGGMERVSEEMNESYILGYVPPNPAHDGRFHEIRVKVDRAGTEVRARNGYFDSKGPDYLAGKPEGRMLEARMESSEAGEIPVTLRAPYFYIKPGIARVNLALSIPGSAIDFEKQKDNFHSQLIVLGIAYRNDGSVAARFSDTVNLDYAKDEMKDLVNRPYDYQNSFKIAPGEYTFKLVLSAGGGKFGKYVVPLVVDPFSDQQFTLSSPAFGNTIMPCLLGSADIDQGLIEGSAPLVTNGVQFVPSSKNRFKQDTRAFVYIEVFDPLLERRNLQMGILFDIVNGKTHQKVYSSNTVPIDQYVHPGSPKVPAIFQLPVDKLPAGDYLISVRGRDSAGNASSVRSGEFSIE